MTEPSDAQPPFRFSLIRLIISVNLIGIGTTFIIRLSGLMFILAVLCSTVSYIGVAAVLAADRNPNLPDESVSPGWWPALDVALFVFMLFSLISVIAS